MQLLNARWARALLTCCINSVSVPLPSVFFSAKCHWAVSGSWNWKKFFFKKSFLKSVLAQNSLPEAVLSTGLDDKEWEKSSTSHEWPFIHICIKTSISRAELFCLESFSMTPDKISKKVLFEFWHFHAFALWLIHNIYWAPVSFFTAKREDRAILWISSWFLLFVPIQTLLGLIQWTSATGATPSSTRGRERFNFQRS